MTEYRTIYPCTCGSRDYLDLQIWQDDDDAENIFICTVVNPQRHLIDRIRGAWGILTGRDHYVHSEVILSRDQVSGLAQELNERCQIGGVVQYTVTTSNGDTSSGECIIDSPFNSQLE